MLAQEDAEREVNERNAIRQTANLPLLDVPAEVRRQINEAACNEYEAVIERYRPLQRWLHLADIAQQRVDVPEYMPQRTSGCIVPRNHRVHAALREIVEDETGVSGPEHFMAGARMHESAIGYGDDFWGRPAARPTVASPGARSPRKPVLFLDIDGPLLIPDATDHRGAAVFALASGAINFIRWASTTLRLFWLSTRSRSGSPEGARRAIRLARGPALLEADQRLIHAIPAIEWSTSKAAAILPCETFWWLDDAPTDEDLALLRQHCVEDRLIRVDSTNNADALPQARAALTQAVGL